jgi:hypothetical protein
MIRVTNKYADDHCAGVPVVYIGRPTVLSNPFSHRPENPGTILVPDRETAIEMYRVYLVDKINLCDPPVTQELLRLADIAFQTDLELGCFCAPKACHGDVIAEAVNHLVSGKTLAQTARLLADKIKKVEVAPDLFHQ